MPRTPADAAALVNLPAQHSKEIGHALDLVQDHQPIGMELEIPPRIREAGDIPWVLKIEVQAVGGFSRDCAGERRLPDLARSEKRHGWNLFEKLQDASLVSAIYHPCQFNVYRSISKENSRSSVGRAGTGHPALQIGEPSRSWREWDGKPVGRISAA